MAGTLYVVATPIGNLEDLTPRAARVLGEVDLLAAENSAVARKLLQHIGLSRRPTPYNDRNRARTSGRLLAALAAEQDVALICDAGTPGLSDPGQDLVRLAREAGATVVPVAGPSTVAALISVAGVWGSTFRSMGFPPRKAGDRRRAFERIAELGEPTIVFESPHRIQATLAELAVLLPEARLVVGRELTKLHEEVWEGSPAQAVAHFRSPRGEFALFVVPPALEAKRWTDPEVVAALRRELAAGVSRRDAAILVAKDSGWARREVYRLVGPLVTNHRARADGR